MIYLFSNRKMDIWGKHQLPNLLTNQENINTNLRSVEKSFFDDNWIDFGKVDKLSQRNRSILAVKNDKDVDNLFEKRTFLPSAGETNYLNSTSSNYFSSEFLLDYNYFIGM